MSAETTGPRPHRSPVNRADRAVAALRDLDGTVYADPPELYAVLVRLTQATRATQQALEQAGQWLRAEQAAGRVGTDDGSAVDVTLSGIAHATSRASDLVEFLDAAAGSAGHLLRTV